jgi:DNA-directed RNA polymerase specialized sigma24 family protein
LNFLRALRSQIGDETASRELIELQAQQLLRYTRKMMGSSPARIEDLLQEIWLAVYLGLPGLLDAARFRAWTFRIARDRIYREYRGRKIMLQSLDECERHRFPRHERRIWTLNNYIEDWRCWPWERSRRCCS